MFGRGRRRSHRWCGQSRRFSGCRQRSRRRFPASRRRRAADQQPVLVVAAGMLAAHPHQHPIARGVSGRRSRFEIALGVRGLRVGIGGVQLPRPDHRGAGAVLLFGNDALKPPYSSGSSSTCDRQPLFAGSWLSVLSDRPALQHPVEFEPEIVMQAAGHVLLDHKGQLRRRVRPDGAARRFRGFREIALSLYSLSAIATVRPSENRCRQHCRMPLHTAPYCAFVTPQRNRNDMPRASWSGFLRFSLSYHLPVCI